MSGWMSSWMHATMAVFLLAAFSAAPSMANEKAIACASCDQVAQATDGRSGGHIEPRYQPREPEPDGYDDKYIFAMTRGVADSTIHPAVQVPLMVLTIPLDLALLPFAAVAGLF